MAKPFLAKCKPFCAICKPSYLGFSEEICKTFQEPALSHHAHYAPHNPDSNLWGHHFGRVQVRSWFARFGRFARRLPPDVRTAVLSNARPLHRKWAETSGRTGPSFRIPHYFPKNIQAIEHNRLQPLIAIPFYHKL